MPTGTIKYVDQVRGFAFISRDDKLPKVYVQISEARKVGVDVLEKGQRWTFDLETNEGGQVFAVNLTFLGYRD
ncbi:MAG: cold shock domain-containing protein [Sphingomonadales bacterium]|nr:cold shock domain-containing protein [Sphingomonadales bacterium]NCP28320.1 cold shock domain-containing protein [Sphingomonadales bacterium]NCQ22473.1 cold shock domain-containing protein [Sphingomonadales bacterium]NCQ63460.1 cold shock domain-containing protein [Alphaproteobacteria bacterium]